MIIVIVNNEKMDEKPLEKVLKSIYKYRIIMELMQFK